MENPCDDMLASVRTRSSEILSHFAHVHDPRQQKKVDYPKDEVILLMLLANAANQDTHVDIEDWGKAKLSQLQLVLPFENGIPTHGTIGNINKVLDADGMEQGYASLLRSSGLEFSLNELRMVSPWRKHIAVDGKYERRSHDRKRGKGPEVMVNALDVERKIPLAQVAVEKKSNEIKAIPKLLDLLGDIDRCLLTLDAIYAQRDICQGIVEKNADYIVNLKRNQESLYDDIKLFVDEQKEVGWENTKVTHCSATTHGHGRTETRTVTVIEDVEWIQQMHKWPGLKSVVVMQSERETVYAADELDLTNEVVEEAKAPEKPTVPAKLQIPVEAKTPTQASHPPEKHPTSEDGKQGAKEPQKAEKPTIAKKAQTPPAEPPAADKPAPKTKNKKEKPETRKKLKKVEDGVKRIIVKQPDGTISVKEMEMRLYLASLIICARLFFIALLGHWGVESFHWVMDVIWGSDDSRLRTGFGARNFCIMRKISYLLVQRLKERLESGLIPEYRNISLRRCRNMSAYSEKMIMQMLH